jgi:hypothetical protein
MKNIIKIFSHQHKFIYNDDFYTLKHKNGMDIIRPVTHTSLTMDKQACDELSAANNSYLWTLGKINRLQHTYNATVDHSICVKSDSKCDKMLVQITI